MIPIPLPPNRGPEYDQRLQSFLKQGEMHRMHSRFVVVKRSTRGRDIIGYEYGLCCFGCGNVTWNPREVEARYCPNCGVDLTAPITTRLPCNQ